MIPNDSLDTHSAQVDHERPDKPEEACGVFGVYAPGEDVAKLTYFGLYALQHRAKNPPELPPLMATRCIYIRRWD